MKGSARRRGLSVDVTDLGTAVTRRLVVSGSCVPASYGLNCAVVDL